jgi:hypothetical protein
MARSMATLMSALAPIGAAVLIWPSVVAHGTGGAASGDVAIQRLTVPGRVNATPSIAALGDVVAVAWTATIPGGAGDVYVAISRDGGAQFAAPVLVNDQPGEARNGGEMPPRVVLVLATSPRDPEVVVVWRARVPLTSIRYARSRDGGRTFAPAATLQSAEAVGERGWQTATAGPDGRVHAVWLDHRGLAPAGASTGGAAGSGGAAHRHGSGQHGAGAATGAPFDGVAMAQRSGLYFASVPSTSGATTEGAGVAGAERELAKGVCYCCKTALVAGANGAVYAAWRHVYEGNIRDIAFVASRDGGRTFEAPTRVSADGWQLAGCPDDGPAMAADGTGAAHVVWPTVVAGERPEGGIFHASTRDGRTFTPRLRVPTPDSLKPSHPQLALARDGRVAIAWDESVDGVRRAMVTTLTTTGTSPAFSERMALEPRTASAPAVAVYPVLAATPSHIVAAWVSGTGDSSSIAVRLLP